MRDSELLGAALVIVFVSVFIFGGAYLFASMRCASQARAMGVSHTYGGLQGCVIEAPNGQWVPMENFRVL